jgi:hypothetical protein
MTRSRRGIAAVLAWLFILSGLGNAQGLVLCLGVDGHAKIELSQENCCSDPLSVDYPSTGGVRQQAGPSQSSRPHCGECVDIPLGVADPAKQPGLILQDSGTSLKAPVTVPADSFSHLSQRIPRQGVPAPQYGVHDTLASLRAVVLQI